MSFLIKNFDKVLLIILLLIFLILNLYFLLLEPQVWPDEAYLADVAYNISQNAGAGTYLWGNTIVGINKSLYWYPPIYTNILAVWFKLFGLTIASQRVLSVSIGILFLIVLYFFIQTFLNGMSLKRKKIAGLSLVLLLIIDNTYLKSSRIGRPEILVVFFGFLSLIFYQLTKKAKSKDISLILTGLFSALAFLTHFFGIFFFLLISIDSFLEKKFEVKKCKKIIYLIIAFSLPVAVWLISILPNLSIFLQQLSLQSSFRTVVSSYIVTVFQHSPIEQKIIYIIYILLSVISLISILTKKLVVNFHLMLGLIAGWLICSIGKLEWYPPYIISFMYILAVMNISSVNTKRISRISVLLIAVLFLLNIKIYYNSVNSFRGKGEAYYQFGQDVKNIIPQGKTIYLSTTPDLYFLLRVRNPLYEFPGVRPDKEEYLKLLNESDYIVINFHLERLFLGNLLDKYIDLNAFRIYPLSGGGLYNAQVIELVPKNMRQLPK